MAKAKKKTDKRQNPSAMVAHRAVTQTNIKAKKKRNKLPPYKMVTLEGTIGVLIEDAFSEFQNLRNEMQEIVDNMSGANMEHLPKYETAEAAQSELDEHADNEPSDIPDFLESLPIKYSELVNRKKGRGQSRDIRCSNAQSMLQAIIDFLLEWVEAKDAEIEKKFKGDTEPSTEEKKLDEQKEAAEALAQELQEHVDFTVDFPGFYG